MKVGIVGAGAMGSIFAYFFSRGGVDTVLFEKDESAVAAIKSGGLNFIIDDETERLDFDIDTRSEILSNCDIIFLFVKTYSTEEAVKAISDSTKNSIIVTLQNGIGNRDILIKYISEERVVSGSTSIGATKMDENTVRLGGLGNVVIGGAQDAVLPVEEILRKSGIDVSIAENPDTEIWKKAIINAGINPLGALLGVPNGLIASNEYSLKLQDNIVRESVKVAGAMGIALDPDEMADVTQSVCEKTAKNLCSMLQDVSAKRRTEIDSINGIIIEYGKEHGIDTSFNEAIYLLVKAAENS